MPDYGVLPEGFRAQTIPEARAEIEEELRQEFGRGFPLGDHTFAGHTVGIMSERLGLLWEVAEMSYSAMDPDKATGDQLRALGALTGSFELQQSASVVEEILTGDDASLIPSGRVISTSLGKRFTTAQATTLVALDPWQDTEPYAEGERVTNAGRCYQCTVGGISAGSGGPDTADAAIVDGTVTWTYLGEGTAAGDCVMVCTELGPVVAVARDLTTIETPVGGWSSAMNLEDAVLGNDVQTDESFRLQRERELHAPGTGPYEAVRQALSAVVGVTSVSILFNTTDSTDANGLPPHSFEALVSGGEEQEIFQTIWDNAPLGIGTFGSTTGEITDSEGRPQEINFSRPTEKLIYAKITLQKVPGLYAGDDSVKEAVALAGDALGLAHDIFSSAVSHSAFVAGVKNVTETLISIHPTNPPVSAATLVMGVRDLPAFDTARVFVVSSDVTP